MLTKKLCCLSQEYVEYIFEKGDTKMFSPILRGLNRRSERASY